MHTEQRWSDYNTNVLEYDYFRMYSSMISLEHNLDYFHDYFHEYTVSNPIPRCRSFPVAVSSVLVTAIRYPRVIINQTTFSGIE